MKAQCAHVAFLSYMNWRLFLFLPEITYTASCIHLSLISRSAQLITLCLAEPIVQPRGVSDRIKDRTGPAAITEIRPGSVCSSELSTHV